MQDGYLKDLCRGFCQAVGCAIEEKDPELWIVSLTPELARRHRTPSWTWCFHRELLDRDGHAQLIAPGSPALRAIQETLRGSGLFAEVAFANRTEVPSSVPAGLRAVNGSLTLMQSRLVYRSLVRLQFRAVRVGSDPCEEYFPVTLDAQTLEECSETLATLLSQHDIAREGREPDSKTQGIQSRRLLKKAYAEAENRLAPLLAMWDKQARTSLAEEHAQAESYYDQRIEAENDATRQQEFTRLKQQRLLEIEERHQVTVQLEAISALLYRLPIARLEISLASGTRSLVFALDRDLLSTQWSSLTCTHHPDKRLDAVALCAEHGLVCQSCHWMCTSCQTPWCSKCPRVSCTTCSQKHCPGCMGTCASCGKKHCHRSLLDCGSGCGTVCASCAVSCAGERFCRRCTMVATCGHPTVKSQAAACSRSAQETFCPACRTQELRPCNTCAEPVCQAHSLDCEHCNSRLCTQCEVTLGDGRKVCPEHTAVCLCGRRELSVKVNACQSCETSTVCVACASLVRVGTNSSPCAPPVLVSRRVGMPV